MAMKDFVDRRSEPREKIMLGTEWVAFGEGMTVNVVLELLKKRSLKPILLEQYDGVKPVLSRRTNLALTGYPLHGDDYDRMEMVRI